jgi:3-phenylpropionate/trans-cinnamate dioxygenase ferredoxin component
VSKVRLCALAELSDDAATRFVVDGVKIAATCIDGRVYAIGDVCSHADYSLSEGELYASELELECPKHGSTFSLLDGEPQCLPATAPVAVYATSLDGDDVYVELP